MFAKLFRSIVAILNATNQEAIENSFMRIIFNWLRGGDGKQEYNVLKNSEIVKYLEK